MRDKIITVTILLIVAMAAFAATQPVLTAENALKAVRAEINGRLVRDVYDETRAIVEVSAVSSDNLSHYTVRIAWNAGSFSIESYRFVGDNTPTADIAEGGGELVLYSSPGSSVDIELTLRVTGETGGENEFSLDIISSLANDRQATSPEIVALHKELTLSGEPEDPESPPIPTKLALNQNSPNPFNAATTIKYDLPVASEVRVNIYDILGRTVCTLADGKKPAGFHRAIWDGTDFSGMPVSSGVYFVKMTTTNVSRVIRIELIK